MIISVREQWRTQALPEQIEFIKFLEGASVNACERRRAADAVSPVSNSILQLIKDSAVQSVNIRQLVENLSKPVLV